MSKPVYFSGELCKMVGFCCTAEKLTPIVETPLEKDLPGCSAFPQTQSREGFPRHVPGTQLGCHGAGVVLVHQPLAARWHRSWGLRPPLRTAAWPDMSIALCYRLALGAGCEDGRHQCSGRLEALPGLDVQGCVLKGWLVRNRWSYVAF